MREVNSYFAILTIIILSAFSGAAIFANAADFSAYNSSPLSAGRSIIGIYTPDLEGRDFFETTFRFQSKEVDVSNKDIVAGIIPHHLLAADMIAEFFKNLEDKDYDTIVLIGPNHSNLGENKTITSSYDWQTPYGVLECDDNLYASISSSMGIGAEESFISEEHSITSELAFIKRTFPDAKILPIILKSTVNAQEAAGLARGIYETSKEQHEKVLVLASADFSHYKNSAQAQADDIESIAAINNSDFESVYDLAVDSPSSIFAVMEFGRLSGAEFLLLNNSNSALLSGKLGLESTTSYVTGYFASR
ncbi:MAG: AmmeMemoRadiSam system protein B [Candidatus Pacebacteria bacterium]|nr:AmmeMemoRadiSam system protein B [Candidatus Paceibacterota bacterium]